MKTIGFIGGMSWESSLEYYRIANQKVRELKGGFSSCKCLMYSVDFAEVEKLQHQNDWQQLSSLMADAARRLYRGGAEILVLCTNTMHLCSTAIEAAVPIPLIHIADATGQRIQTAKLSTVGLLGTRFTMEKNFYKQVLLDRYNIRTLIPTTTERKEIHRIIYDELVNGIIRNDSRAIFKEIIENLRAKGAGGVVLGCTEIPLLIQAKDVAIPVFDTTAIHTEKAVEYALATVDLT